MITARQLEMKLSSLYKAGKIVGGVYLGKGQEAVSAALAAELRWGHDVFAPLIRDQGGRTAFGESLHDAARSHLGSVEGPMRGRDGNIHRGHPREGLLAMISHLGAGISVAVGVLFAKRLKGELDGVVGAACIGDGGTSTGAFHEAANLAAVEKLPLVLLVVDNQFAYSTPTSRQFACENLYDRAKGYGMTGHRVDGTDFLACVKVMHEAVQRARDGGGPQMVVANLLRLAGHGEHDDASYVPEELRQSELGRDCLEVGEQQMLDQDYATADEIAAWRQKTNDEVQMALATAQREARPDPWHETWETQSTPLPRPHES